MDQNTDNISNCLKKIGRPANELIENPAKEVLHDLNNDFESPTPAKAAEYSNRALVTDDFLNQSTIFSRRSSKRNN